MRVAAGQFAVPPFDTEAGVEAACDAIRSAAAEGVELLVLPETFLGGYPYWRGHVTVRQETELSARLWEAAVRADGPAVDELSRAVREHGVGLVIGVNERDLRPGSGSYYNAQLMFTPDEGYVASHRKLVPTHTERAYWAAGTADDIYVIDVGSTPVGALICYEHHMLAARMALALAGEVIHCAAWPGYWETGAHIADKIPGPARLHGEIDAVVRDYALSSQSFVVSANAYLPDRVIPAELTSIMQYNLARGGSAVVDPSGRYLAPPMLDEEGLVIADCDPKARTVAKSYLDTVGHYARWDIFEFRVRPAGQRGEDVAGRAPGDGGASPARPSSGSQRSAALPEAPSDLDAALGIDP